VPHGVGGLLDYSDGAGDIGVAIDLDVQQRARPLLRLVPHPLDLAVGDVPDDALDVADTGRSQAHAFDGAADATGRAPDGSAHVDDIAHAVLVLDEHEEPRQEVADEGLGTEAERDTEHAGAGDQRREVDPELAQHDQHRDAPDNRIGEPPQHVGHRLRTLRTTRARRPARVDEPER
jgi:hypothetical protein